MIKLMSSTYVLTFAAVILLTRITDANRNAFDLNLATIVKTFISPILNPGTDSEVENKKKEEKHMLDEDNKNQHLTEYSEDETIILEDKPKTAKKNSYINTAMDDSSFAKYKQLRNKIGGLLKKEEISNKTQGVINNVFDKMMSSMNKCVWNKKSRDLPPNRKSERAIKMALLDSWKQKFNSLINRFYKQREDSNDLSGSKETMELLVSLRELFFEMHNDFQKLITRYDLVCNIVDEKKISRAPMKFNIVRNPKSLDVNDDVTHQKSRPDTCEFYIICAHELQDFSKDFYADLQETVDQVLNNYLNMYLADEPKESSFDKSLFTDIIKHVNRYVKTKFNATFYKEFNKMDLDTESDTKLTVEGVKEFIGTTVKNIKALIEDVLSKKVSALPDKIRYTVIQDIMTNTDIELGNVQETFKDKICSTFQTCHGKYVRRFNNYSTKPGEQKVQTT